MVPDSGIMTHTMNSLTGVFAAGASNLQGAAIGLLSVLVAIEIVWAGIQITFGSGDQIFQQFLRKIVKVGVFILIVTNLPALMNEGMQAFARLGGQVGGADVSVLTNPTAILDKGLLATQAAWTDLADVSLMDGGILTALLMAIVSLFALALYFVIAIQVFVVVVEFYVIAAFAAVFVPWGVNPHTRFVAERYIGAVIASGTKLMVTVAMMSVLNPIISSLALPNEPTFYHVVSLAFGIGTIAVLIVKVPSVAGGLMSGSASLSGGDAIGAGAGAASIAGGTAIAAAAGATGNAPAAILAAKKAVSGVTALSKGDV